MAAREEEGEAANSNNVTENGAAASWINLGEAISFQMSNKGGASHRKPNTPSTHLLSMLIPEFKAKKAMITRAYCTTPTCGVVGAAMGKLAAAFSVSGAIGSLRSMCRPPRSALAPAGAAVSVLRPALAEAGTG